MYSLNGSQPQVIGVLGPTATGKTTTIGLVLKYLENDGKQPAFINDYEIMMRWVQDPEVLRSGKAELIGDTFNIAPEAYPELSTYVASEVGKRAKQLITESRVDVVFFETARGAGEPIHDEYGRDCAVPIMSEIYGVARFSAVVFDAPYEVLRGRAERRFESDSTAPPPFVLDKYFRDGKPRSNAAQEMQALGVPNLVINSHIATPKEVATRLYYWSLEGRHPESMNGYGKER